MSLNRGNNKSRVHLDRGYSSFNIVSPCFSARLRSNACLLTDQESLKASLYKREKKREKGEEFFNHPYTKSLSVDNVDDDRISLFSLSLSPLILSCFCLKNFRKNSTIYCIVLLSISEIARLPFSIEKINVVLMKEIKGMVRMRLTAGAENKYQREYFRKIDRILPFYAFHSIIHPLF